MTVTGAQPRAGMKVLMKVYPQFHEAYGFSWIVTDIDPTYTLGDMARRRQEIVRRLKEEGVFDLNKQLPLPLFAQRIAVVSSQTAAGLGDFCQQLTHNGYGFAFTIELFTATMQGEGVEQSVVAALNDIYGRADRFDCVVIIRGGGATSDLSGFDSLMLAENIANFPLPVITGIGHDRDETVADMVAHTRVKTPTAAAALLIDNLKAVADRIDTAARRIHDNTRLLMQRETQRLDRITHLIPTYSLLAPRHGSHDGSGAAEREAADGRRTYPAGSRPPHDGGAPQDGDDESAPCRPRPPAAAQPRLFDNDTQRQGGDRQQPALSRRRGGDEARKG